MRQTPEAPKPSRSLLESVHCRSRADQARSSKRLVRRLASLASTRTPRTQMSSITGGRGHATDKRRLLRLGLCDSLFMFSCFCATRSATILFCFA